MRSSSRVEKYRAAAAQLRRLARQTRFAECRLQALGLAQKFERLADYAEQHDAANLPPDPNLIPFRRAS